MTVKEGWRGRFFEDFAVGDAYEHALGRTITSADNKTAGAGSAHRRGVAGVWPGDLTDRAPWTQLLRGMAVKDAGAARNLRRKLKVRPCNSGLAPTLILILCEAPPLTRKVGAWRSFDRYPNGLFGRF